MAIDPALVERLHRQARAERWRVSLSRFAEALDASIRKASTNPRDVDRYLGALHLEDLALACACADGDGQAWDHFVLEHRPALYRAANALDATGGARDLADSLYAELFGLRERSGERQSLLHCFHGRSSLSTWLHAVLTQRYIDRLRASRRAEPLPDEESPAALVAPRETVDPDRVRHLSLIREALEAAIAALPPRDRLRLACYYAQQLTLAETGRMLGEHEATVSRQLARTRTAIRQAVEHELRVNRRLGEAEVAECFASVAEDAGALDLQQMLDHGARKESAPDRSR